jgi:serine O-acetyltransferase
MDLQKHSRVLNETIEELSDESSYKKLFHDYRDDEVLPSGKVLKEIVDLCHAVLFPGYYGHTKINKQTVKFHTGVYVNTLHTLLTKQIYSGLSFFGIDGVETSILNQSQELSSKFILSLPSIRAILATDAEAAYDGDPAATDLNEIIFCYPGFRAICNYRIAHKLFELGVPYIPRMITEMAHSDTGIDIHPGAKIGHSFSIDHGTGTVIGETSVIGNHVRLFQGVSLSGEQLSDCCSQAIRGAQRHPILEDRVTIYSNSTLIGRIRIGEGAVICGNVWVTEDVPAGAIVSQKGIDKNV